MALRILFMGTPDFAVPTLERLVAQGHELLAVSQPARPAGRGLKPRPSPVAAAAARLAVPVLERATLRGDGALAPLRDFHPDLIVVVAFGLILRRAVLDLPQMMAVNLHPSRLPRHRGVAPIPWTILAGDRETAVATIRMDEGVDTGDLLLVESTVVGGREGALALAARLAESGADLVARTVTGVASGDIRPQPQGEEGATYAPRLAKEHGHVDWERPAEWTDRQIRALQGWPGTRAVLGGEVVEILAADPEQGDAGGRPGTILSCSEGGMEVATGEGRLRITRVKPSGKREMTALAFACGRRLAGGARWESLPGAAAAQAELTTLHRPPGAARPPGQA